jgi:predicted glycosyltransferase
LNPIYYAPNKKIYDYLNIDYDEKYCVIRLNAFDAYSHDYKIRGLSSIDLDHLIESLEPIGKVFILPESKISSKYNKYVLNFPVHMIFDLLFYSDLVCTETAMATESVILGTPTLLFHELALNFSDYNTLNKFGLKICDSNYLLKNAAPLFKIGKNKKLSFEQIFHSNFNKADDPNMIVMKLLNSLL